MSNSYETPASHSDDLLKVVSRTVTGRGLLEEFLPFLTKRKVSIEDYPGALREKLRKFIPPGHPIGACFLEGEDANSARILVDFEGPRGIVAAYLVHEISCFLARCLRSTLCREETEAEAMKKQLQFTAELRDRDPDYERFLKANAPKASRLNGLLEFEADDPSNTGRAA